MIGIFKTFALCFQVSQVYQTVEFSRLLSLVPFASEFQLERAIVDVALENELQVIFTVKLLI